ncbi:two-component regulator propeller domain-containing protein [Aurantibacter sp.]|uniref:two-component regulator propeller domain-containing protein n=1 Tax=Aurantibacter sp. TaxID=2807103 RepID=UPI0032646547
MRPKLIFVFFLLMTALGMYKGSSQEQIYFDHITTDDGLSQSDINGIYQDEKGFMWFATHDGLNKYDGYDFTVFKPESNKVHSISSNLIFEIVGDKSGNLWIGTTGRGLNFFNQAAQTFETYENSADDESSLSNNHISKLYRDRKNRLWIGTNKGLNMLDLNIPRDSAVFKKFNPANKPFITGWDGKSIFAIFEDSQDQLWVGGHGGLYLQSRDSRGEIYFSPQNENLGLPAGIVRCITEDKHGKFIFAMDDGLYYPQEQNGEYKMLKFQNGTFNQLLVDKNNSIWAGSENGLYRFTHSKQDEKPQLQNHFKYHARNTYGLSKNIVRSLFMDKSGIIWVGTNGGGINKYDPARKMFRHIRKGSDLKSLSYDKIRAMYEDSNGALWIGTEGGGLNMLIKENDDGKYNKFTIFDNIKKPFAITEFNHNGRKKLFVGAENAPGLYEVEITSKSQIHENDFKEVSGIGRSVFSLLVDSENNLWIGTYGEGIHKWSPDANVKGGFKKRQFKNDLSNDNSISNNIIRSIYEDSDHNIWFATGKGLSMLPKSEKDKKLPKFEVYFKDPNDKNSLPHNYILSLFEDTSGNIWIGTFGGGLAKFVDDDSGSFVVYDEENGLPNNVIKSILEDDEKQLWLSTNQGLSRFDLSNENFTNYDTDDGLQNSEFQELASVKRKSGEMLFGGINGFNAFYPQQIKRNSFEAETVLTNFTIFNEPVAIGDEINGRILLKNDISQTETIDLKYKENNVAFEFAALHYAAPRKNEFTYILEGFDKDWISTTSDKRFATYTNLPAGEYIFKVKASNNDGLWDQSPAEIELNVSPPFWLTKTAFAFYSLFAFALLWLFYKYTFIRTTKKYNLELEHVEKEKNDELQRSKLEFFTNISHEFRTPLTLIKGPLEYLQKNTGNLDKDELEEQYGLMQKNTSYLLKLVNQLLDFRKIDRGKMQLVVRNSDILSFIKEIGEPFQFLAHKKNVSFEINSSEKVIRSWFDHDALEKVINNLLSNAFKYTPENGTISVLINKDVKNENGFKIEMVKIQVSDTGQGISQKRVKTIFNRFNSSEINEKQNLQGAGIGLSFTKNLIELHKGSIEVFSQPEMGSNFIVRFPIKRKAYENIPEISIKEETDADFLVRSSETESFAIDLNDELIDENLSKSRSKLPILLIVDDNSEIRLFIKQALKSSYVIYEAENGKLAFELTKKIMPNIILTDIVMPAMNGIELCEQLKSKEETSHIPIIMLTAKASQESEIQGLSKGVDGYIRKPFDLELLQLKLSNILKQREQLRKQFTRDIQLRPKDVTVTTTDERFLNEAIEIVEKHMANTDFNVEMLVNEMNISRSNLYLKFKAVTGLSSSEFIRNIRLKRAVQLLEQSGLSVKEIMYMTGFNTASYFSKCFKKQFGVIPSEYVRQTKKDKN